MGFKIYGVGEILVEDGETQKIASKQFTEDDLKALAKENAAADFEVDAEGDAEEE